MNVKDSVDEENRTLAKPVNGSVLPKKVLESRELEEDDETKSLLSPRADGLSKKSAKPGRKVQWNDRNGNKLAEVLEYQPSDSSDSDDDEDTESCICSIM